MNFWFCIVPLFIWRCQPARFVQKSVERIQMKRLSWVMLESVGPSKSKGCGVRHNARETAALLISIVRFCICRYRRRVRKGPHDRNDRRARPRGSLVAAYVDGASIRTTEFLVRYWCNLWKLRYVCDSFNIQYKITVRIIQNYSLLLLYFAKLILTKCIKFLYRHTEIRIKLYFTYFILPN